jgi:hypothetical protein
MVVLLLVTNNRELVSLINWTHNIRIYEIIRGSKHLNFFCCIFLINLPAYTPSAYTCYYTTIFVNIILTSCCTIRNMILAMIFLLKIVTSHWQNYFWLFCQRLVTIFNKKIVVKNHISCSVVFLFWLDTTMVKS